MNKRTFIPCLLLTGILVGSTAQADTANPQAGTPKEAYRNSRDNTGINERDRNAASLTADQQSNQGKALELTKRIRQAIVEREDLSQYAHNIKVVTNDGGMVTLRGPVRSDQERVVLGQIAMDIAGTNFVRNELEVAAQRSKS